MKNQTGGTSQPWFSLSEAPQLAPQTVATEGWMGGEFSFIRSSFLWNIPHLNECCQVGSISWVHSDALPSVQSWPFPFSLACCWQLWVHTGSLYNWAAISGTGNIYSKGSYKNGTGEAGEMQSGFQKCRCLEVSLLFLRIVQRWNGFQLSCWEQIWSGKSCRPVFCGGATRGFSGFCAHFSASLQHFTPGLNRVACPEWVHSAQASLGVV